MGHGRARLDEQSLHLVKHRVMRGVGGVRPIDPSQRDDPQRRRAVFHDADLHRARLRTQQERVGTASHCQIEIIERITRRMLGRDGKGLEIMPLILDLRSVDALEAQAGHDLLHTADRLRDRMDVAQPYRLARQGHVDRIGRSRPGGGTTAREPLLDVGKERRDRSLGLVEMPAAGGSVTGRQAREEFLDRLEPSAPRTEKLDPRLLQSGAVCDPSERLRSSLAKRGEFGQKRLDSHGVTGRRAARWQGICSSRIVAAFGHSHGTTRPQPAPATQVPSAPHSRRHRSRWDRARPSRTACGDRVPIRFSRGRR